ncbi:hypothetical protein BDF19DRAFT_432803 [Syncephalis fuscata]|nr:hypothetical protein BDF19DRAFT_432803 [Syncephalis fuscata]
MFNNIGTLILLLCFVVSVFGTATFRVGNQTLQYHTQDLFEVEVEPYTTRGVLVSGAFNPNSTCEILPSVLNTAQSALDNVKSDNITSVIIAIDAIEANEYGCTTIAHTGVAVFELNQYLNDTSNFSIDTVLYISYTKSGLGFGASPVNIALLPLNDFLIVAGVPIEPGPWNDAFLSIGYRAFIYCTLAVFVTAILYSVVSLYHLIKTKRAITKQQIIIYVSALCAAILCASGFALKLNSLVYKYTSFLQSVFVYIGFYTLLLLWHSIAINVKNTRQLILLRYGIIIAFFMALIDQALQLIFEFTSIPEIQSTLVMTINYFRLATQSIIIVAFVYYGIVFWLKQGTLLGNSNVKHALLLVTKLCAIFSLGYLMLFTGNMMEEGETWRYGVGAEVARIVLFKLSYVVRIGVLLFVIDLRPKSDSQCKDKAKIEVDSRKCITTSIQTTHNDDTLYAGALMSSNIDPDARLILENSTYYNMATVYN